MPPYVGILQALSLSLFGTALPYAETMQRQSINKEKKQRQATSALLYGGKRVTLGSLRFLQGHLQHVICLKSFKNLVIFAANRCSPIA